MITYSLTECKNKVKTITNQLLKKSQQKTDWVKENVTFLTITELDMFLQRIVNKLHNKTADRYLTNLSPFNLFCISDSAWILHIIAFMWFQVISSS